MRSDGTLRPPKPPRALVVATGEDVPRGHSITARLFVRTLAPRVGDLPRLSACQRDAAAGRYSSAMAGYLAWLAPQFPGLWAALDAERVELRDRFVGRFPHARTPDIVANLLLGLHTLLRFAAAVGAIDAPEQVALWARGQAAFRVGTPGGTRCTPPARRRWPRCRRPGTAAAARGRRPAGRSAGRPRWPPRPRPGRPRRCRCRSSCAPRAARDRADAPMLRRFRRRERRGKPGGGIAPTS